MGLGVEQMDRFFLDDIDTHNRRMQYHTKDLRRRLVKAKHFPMTYLIKEMHGKEEYRAYARIDSKSQPFKDGIDFDSVIYFNNSKGRCAYINLDPFKIIGTHGLRLGEGNYCGSHRYLFTPHFFERYEMRFGLGGEYGDIYNQFFFNNLARDKGAFYTQMCTARPDDYKTIDVWSLCNDGLMLGEVKSEEDFKSGKPYIIQINTFLDLDTLTRRQDRYSNVLKSMKEVFERMPWIESEEDEKKRTFVTTISNL